MSEIYNIPNITTNGGGIPYIENGVPIQVNGTGIQFVQKIQSTDTSIRPIGVGVIADARVFEAGAPTVIPPVVPVTEVIGTPIVNLLSLIHI